MTARRITLGSALAAIAAIAFAAAIDVTPRLIFNGSRSAPIGFYTLSSDAAERGDLVLASAPERVRSLVAERQYLPANVPLLKRISAAAGDLICRIETEISVNGEVVATALAADGSGRPLPVWSGCRVLERGEVFLLQDHPRSFDGRYFGPLNRRLIEGKAAPLWLFGGPPVTMNIREHAGSTGTGRVGAIGGQDKTSGAKAPLSHCLYIFFSCTTALLPMCSVLPQLIQTAPLSVARPSFICGRR